MKWTPKEKVARFNGPKWPTVLGGEGWNQTNGHVTGTRTGYIIQNGSMGWWTRLGGY